MPCSNDWKNLVGLFSGPKIPTASTPTPPLPPDPAQVNTPAAANAFAAVQARTLAGQAAASRSRLMIPLNQQGTGLQIPSG